MITLRLCDFEKLIFADLGQTAKSFLIQVGTYLQVCSLHTYLFRYQVRGSTYLYLRSITSTSSPLLASGFPTSTKAP